jgi:hypothetical protein
MYADLDPRIYPYSCSDDEAGVPSSPGEPVKLLEVSVTAAPQVHHGRLPHPQNARRPPACGELPCPCAQVDTAGFALVDNRATTLGNALHLQRELRKAWLARKQPPCRAPANAAPRGLLAAASARMIKYNLPVDQMHAPIYGPAHPSDKGGVPQALRNHRAGHVEDAHLSTFTFDEQYNTFHRCGWWSGNSAAGWGWAGNGQYLVCCCWPPAKRRTLPLTARGPRQRPSSGAPPRRIRSYGYAQNPSGTGFVAHREGTSRPVDAETVYTLSTKRQRTEGGAAAAAAAAQKQPAEAFDPTQVCLPARLRVGMCARECGGALAAAAARAWAAYGRNRCWRLCERPRPPPAARTAVCPQDAPALG